MSDIFISYSRKDSEHALSLAEQLRSEGMSVWIDQHGIGGAEQWATEIAGAIRGCTSFVLLLSPGSTASDNVLKELSLASEKRKKIIPVDVGRALELPVAFEYALAGIQRLAYGNFDGVLTAIRNTPKQSLVVQDTRKSLMILPFTDLSPAKDNEWFADGLMSELIDMLIAVKSIRLMDISTSMQYKATPTAPAEIAEELDVRYFIEGNVQKIGERIKINTKLFDAARNEYLWSDSHKGSFEDIFEIQEVVARKVVEGLDLHFTKEEEDHLARGTANSEAYALYLRGRDSYTRHTKSALYDTVSMQTEALTLDPLFVNAARSKAQALLAIYHGYERETKHLDEAERLLTRVLALRPDAWSAYGTLGRLYTFQRRFEKAEEAILTLTLNLPSEAYGFSQLFHLYGAMREPRKAVKALEKAIELNATNWRQYWNIVLTYDEMGDHEAVKRWAKVALTHYERRLRLFPDDQITRVEYAGLLRYAGQSEDALDALKGIHDRSDLDPTNYYNIACLFARLEDNSQAMEFLTKAVRGGFGSVEHLREDIDLIALRELPEFQVLISELESRQDV